MIVSPEIVDYIYCDMDGVIADFETKMREKGMHPDDFKHLPGAYLHLPLMPGAAMALAYLYMAFPDRVRFLTKPPRGNPYAYTEKALWMREHFGQEAMDNLIICMDKSHVGTSKSILIDDRPHKGGVANFRGHFVHFDSTWENALADLREIVSDLQQGK